MKKVVVTGGAGFIGSHVVDQLLQQGYEVHVIDDLSTGKKENIPDAATLHTTSIGNSEIEKIMEGAEYVFHLAAMPSVPYSIDHPQETFETNVTGTLSVLEAARKANVKRVIFSSSCAVYGDTDMLPVSEVCPIAPKSPYALHKRMGELQCFTWNAVYGIETVSLRYFNVYGPRMNTIGDSVSVLARFITLQNEGKPLVITGTGEQTRDFIHVRDVARANVLAAESEKVGKGEVINIGYGQRCSIKELAEKVSDTVSFTDARLEIQDSEADIQKAEELLGWKPSVTFDEGIGELLKKA